MTLLFAFDPDQVVMIALTFVLAGMVKGVTGMGLPTVAMGILGSLISPVAAAAMLLLPSLISNLFQFGGGGNTRMLLKRLWPMLLTVVIATLLASVWITGGETSRTQFALGLALMVYALWTLAGKRIAIAPRREKPLSLVVGFATGLLTGGTGVFVMPAVPWIQSLGFEKDELVQALGISFIYLFHAGVSTGSVVARRAPRAVAELIGIRHRSGATRPVGRHSYPTGHLTRCL
ncbi:Sulfite exporter TauE/SafE [Citrobacter amalonaticus]|uniref:Probable membrane transporter protein n=1 Tax=Citrobacter amalonaticus TaxID=35703 RepID=A0A6N2VID0_CITAM